MHCPSALLSKVYLSSETKPDVQVHADLLELCNRSLSKTRLFRRPYSYCVARSAVKSVLRRWIRPRTGTGLPKQNGRADKQKRARQIDRYDYDKFDYIIGMDTANIRNLNRMLKGDPEGKVYKFLTFAGSGRDIADPWYTGNFDDTYRDVVQGCEGFLAYLRKMGQL